MSLVGDEDEAGCGGVQAVADDCEREREAGEGAADPATAAKEAQRQHRPGRQDRDAGQHPEADGVHHGFVRVRQVVTMQKGELWRGNSERMQGEG